MHLARDVRPARDVALADDTTKDKRLESMGMMTALAIGIHNFPEGWLPSSRRWTTTR